MGGYSEDLGNGDTLVIWDNGDGYNSPQPCDNWVCGAPTGGNGDPTYSEPTCHWPFVKKAFSYTEITSYPPTPEIPGQPYIRPSAAVISENLNEGWLNSCSSSVEKLRPGHYFQYTLSHDNRGVFIGLDAPGKELQQLNRFEHGVMIDQSGVYEYESGIFKRQISDSHFYTDIIRVFRRFDGTVAYSFSTTTETVTIESSLHLSTTEEIEVYAIEYRAADVINTASFETIAATGEGEASFEQEAAYYIGIGNSGIFEQEAEITLGLFFVADFAQEAEQTVQMNHNKFAVASPTFGGVKCFATDLELGEYDGCRAILGAVYVSKANDQDAPPQLEGGDMVLAPVHSDAMGITVDIGSGAADLGGAYALGSEDELHTIGMGHPVLGGVTAKSWEEPDGYLAFIEDITLRDDLGMFRSVIMPMVSALSLSDELSVFHDLFIAIDETLGLSDDYDVKATRIMQLEETIGLHDDYSLIFNNLPDFPGGAAWVMNTDSGATTIFQNYDFNSFFTDPVTSIVYGVANNGVYQLNDTTTPTPAAMVDYGYLKLGTSKMKRCPYWYAAVASSGKMILRLDIGGRFFHYEMRSTSEQLDNHRFDTGKGLSSVFWNPTLISPEGVSVEEYESLTFSPIVLSRKI